MSRGPASVLVDESGNLLGVVLDGSVYRLQVEAIVANSDGDSAAIEFEGARAAQAVSYPELLSTVESIGDKLDRILAYMATITGDEEPLR